jgi:hypothetical protein
MGYSVVWQLDSYLLTQSVECYGQHEVMVWCMWQLNSYLLTQISGMLWAA